MRRHVVLATAITVVLMLVAATVAVGSSEKPVFVNKGTPNKTTTHFMAFDTALCKQGSGTLASGGGWGTEDGGFAFDATLLITCDKAPATFEIRLCGVGPPTAFEWAIVGGTGPYAGLTGGGTGYNNSTNNPHQRDHKKQNTDFYLGAVSLDPGVDLTRALDCPIAPD
jgi:hypothetical protein